MKTKIPEELKADVPHTSWGKLLVATPVVMTVIATMLAGLASSEMTRAQYDRAYAAQLQAKAGDQWSYFQAKKLRSALQRNSLDVLEATTDLHPVTTEFLNKAGSQLEPVTLEALTKGTLPKATLNTEVDADLKTAIAAIEEARTEEEIAAKLVVVPDNKLAEALKTARENTIAFDTATKPVNQAIEQLGNKFATGERSANRDFTAAQIRYSANRYDAEARLNQAVANLLELQVRKNNISAERHHRRSGSFFFGMLAAQAAVIVSTFSLAAQKRNFLWSVAAIAGVIAIAFAIYVYLCI